MTEQERVETALKVAAQIVARDGEAFLPVFLRLEAEAEAIAGRNAAMARALALIYQNPSTRHDHLPSSKVI